jgi:FkbM family methyltransferase
LHIENLDRPVTLLVHQGDDLVSREIARQRIWEPYETELLIERLGPGQVFVDVGANIGYYSLIADQLVGESGSIYAFEPEQKNFAVLERNLQNCLCSEVHLHQAGLSDVTREGVLFLSPDNWGDHRVSAAQDRSVQAIELMCGDDLLADRHIDFLKIDTQGAEYQVVKGLQNTINSNSAWLDIIIEYWPWGLAASGSSAEALIELIDCFRMPIQIIDHLANRLVPASTTDLLEFAEQTRRAEVPQGFINLLLSSSGDPVTATTD